ncbi:MAG: pseudouridine synthase, partial [Ruminiclostridium sp.]|nr:pseudouridine synthase [Ruminiclostridium sp.]
MEDRLQKILSAAGICSRRKAEEYITAGRVTVNGHPASLGDRADPARDVVALDGKEVIRPGQRTVLMLYK